MPNGVAFRDGALFVAESGRLLRYDRIESRLDDPPPAFSTVSIADWRPKTGDLWFTDNGRDWPGDDFPPDGLNRASGSTAGGLSPRRTGTRSSSRSTAPRAAAFPPVTASASCASMATARFPASLLPRAGPERTGGPGVDRWRSSSCPTARCWYPTTTAGGSIASRMRSPEAAFAALVPESGWCLGPRL